MASPARVSVIIPVYNTAGLLTEAISSVHRQTVPGIELIVVDDGSDDGAELERVVAGAGPGIRLLRQPNRGVSAARNLGLRQSEGDFLVFLDSDDLLLPNYVARQLEFLTAHPDTAVAYCDAELFGEGAPPGVRFMDQCPSAGEVTFSSLVEQRCTVLTTVMARRAALEAVGGYDEALRSSEDFDLWLRMTKGGFRIGYQRELLARHRIRPGSLASDRVWMYDHALAVLAKAREQLSLTPEETEVVERRREFFSDERTLALTKRALEDGDLPGARRLFRQYRRRRPTLKNLAVDLLLQVSPGLLQRLRRRRPAPGSEPPG
ncbi:MAG TPA: glycosyltransferase family A protein [Gemmatimonadales bacterium]|nr:glycosyltransferase family A protein [Gemmatimonadales bacterium]